MVETIKHPILGASFDTHIRTRQARLHIVSLSSTAYSCTHIPKPKLYTRDPEQRDLNWKIFTSVLNLPRNLEPEPQTPH